MDVQLVVKIVINTAISASIPVLIYKVFQKAIDARFLSTLSQKRKVIVIGMVFFSFWSLGMATILFDTYKDAKTTSSASALYYTGQIIDENEKPIAKAFAYIVQDKDTIRYVPTVSLR